MSDKTVNIVITRQNYQSVLPKKKWDMYLEYLKYGYSEDEQGTMFYNKEKDQFQLN